jgi:hypothetical protein
MPSLISFLPKSEQLTLLDDLNYLNMDEIREFCDEHKVPYTIWVESADKKLRRTRDDDRKGVILDRIRHYLKTGSIPDATRFPSSVVCYDDPPAKLKATDRLFYGQYDKKSESMINLLKSLTVCCGLDRGERQSQAASPGVGFSFRQDGWHCDRRLEKAAASKSEARLEHPEQDRLKHTEDYAD